MTKRFSQLILWLEKTVGINDPQPIAITNDASFRRYYRLILANERYIIMDAPPEKENCLPFIDVAKRFSAAGLNVPQIIAQDLEQGFLLLSDLGDDLYLPQLKNTPECADALYESAMCALVTLQQKTDKTGLPLYDETLLQREMSLFPDWLLEKHISFSLSETEKEALNHCFSILTESALAQPQVIVHRDYHSRNLLTHQNNSPAIIDFQDAVIGGITYDLVSLLRDCYISWSDEQLMTWTTFYFKRAQAENLLPVTATYTEFMRWFDLMGLQRHIKVAGIFARLYHRDGKIGYLADIPQTLRYIIEVSAKYPEFAALHELTKQRVLPAVLSLQSCEV